MSVNQACKSIYESGLENNQKEAAILGIVLSILPKKLNASLGTDNDRLPCIFLSSVDKYYKIRVGIDGWCDTIRFYLNEPYEHLDSTIEWEGVGFDKVTEDVKRAITKGVMSR